MKRPRRDLSFTCSRRRLLPALFQEMAVILGSLKGGQGHRLSDLGSLPDDRLAQIKPIRNPDYEIFADQGHVCSRSKRTQTTLKLFPMEREYLAAFNLFNGQLSLGEIGERLSQEMGWDEATGFASARDLFLSLVRRLVCVPKDPLELDE
jgi:hypothetical protein